MDVAGLSDAVDAMALVSVPERCGSNKENIHRLALAQGAGDPYKVPPVPNVNPQHHTPRSLAQVVWLEWLP